MWKTLLIDDEPAARDELRWLLSEHPDFEIVGEAATFNQARERLATHDYDLVLLDIQLIGGTGFDLVPHIRAGARVIFITAFDQHALRAFEVNALDYLLKPVASERFDAALERLNPGAPPGLSESPRPALRTDDRVLVKLDSATERFIALETICTITAAENYTEVLLADGEKLFVRRTMKSWEESLPAEEFGRVHRAVIVALSRIERIVRHSRVTFEIHLRDHPDPLPISYRLISDLRTRLAARWPDA